MHYPESGKRLEPWTIDYSLQNPRTTLVPLNDSHRTKPETSTQDGCDLLNCKRIFVTEEKKPKKS